MPFTVFYNNSRYTIDMDDNEFRMNGLADGKIATLISEFFFNRQNKDCSYYININNEFRLLHSRIRYFEVETFGLCDYSIGLCNLPADVTNIHIGDSNNTFGLHSLDNYSWFDGVQYKRAQAYGKYPTDHYFVGFGYDSELKIIFLTINGTIRVDKEVDWQTIFAAISIRNFTVMKVNYGDRPFQFNILNYLDEHKVDSNTNSEETS